MKATLKNTISSLACACAMALAAPAVMANKQQEPYRPSDIDFTVGDDSMVLDAGIAMGSRNSYLTAGAAYHRDDGQGGWIGWQMRGHARNAPSLFGGLGISAAYLDLDEDDSIDEGTGIAAPITGLLGYSFVDKPHLRPLSFMFTFAAAPRVLAFSDITNYYSYGALVSWEIIENASILAGYRNISSELEDKGKVRLTKGIHLGISFRF